MTVVQVAEDVTLDMSKVDELAADFWDDFRAFLAPLRQTPVSWVAAGEQFRDQMVAEQFLAWCWKNRRVILTVELRREAGRNALHERRAVIEGTADPETIENVVADLEHRTAQRNGRVDAARARLRGHLSEHFEVPGKVGSMPVGLMDSADLTAVAGSLTGKAMDLTRKSRFLKRLAKGLPKGVLVADHYSEAQVDSMWATFVAVAS